MQIKPARLERRNGRHAVVALACAVVLTALSASPARAAEPDGGMRSAALAVSVSVVRRCTVATPALVAIGDGAAASVAAVVGDAVSLTCSQGAPAAIQVGGPTVESAVYAQIDRHVAATVARASGPLVVTVLF